MPILNLSFTVLPSSAPWAVRTPSAPPGIVTRTCVSWSKPRLGTNVSVLVPAPCQLPATAGLTVGIGEFGASGAENWIVISVVPLTPVALLAGVSEISSSGPAGTCDDALALGLPLAVPACT